MERPSLYVYINGKALGRSESHTLFEGVIGLEYHGFSIESGAKPLLLARDVGRKGSEVWGELDVCCVGHDFFKKFLDGDDALLKVISAEDSKLEVMVGGVYVPKPIAVSFSVEQKGCDTSSKYMVVLEYERGTKLTPEFYNGPFRKRFPKFTRYKEYPHKITREDPYGTRVLMITEDVNVAEVARDHKKINQLFVIGAPDKIKPLHVALTEGKNIL